MKNRTICILGGTGFVGHHLVASLADAGHEIRIPSRRPHRNRDFQVLPTVRLIEADIHEPKQLENAIAGCDTVVNLVGILNEKGHDGKGFVRVHVELPKHVVRACENQGITRLLHMSALHADAEKGPSHYLRTKGEGENAVMSASGERFRTTSFRPSVIFGPGDSFLNRFAGILRITPLGLPLACPNARFAPVYVGDVVRAFVDALDNPASWGRSYDLCGPNEYTLKELVSYTARLTNHRRVIVGLPDWVSALQAATLEYFPGKPFSKDNLHSLSVDSVCDEGERCATSLESVAPVYLGKRDQQSRMQALRKTRVGADTATQG
ncbi:MAG: complex I NDUFA9 subunit family protein [Pseudomonadota bacterium]|nr:complex I NDUFA9 subunit family protein [Pseudomonadota bacterium]